VITPTISATIEEGIKGKRAVQWRLVDEIVPNSQAPSQSRGARHAIAAASKLDAQRKRHFACAPDAQLRR